MSAGVSESWASCSGMVLSRCVWMTRVDPAGVAIAGGMPASHIRSPFGWRIRKQGSDRCAGLPSNSWFGENMPALFMSKLPQSSA